MAVEIVWTNQASQSLLKIYVSIGIHNPLAAERMHQRIETLVGRLARHPRLGPRRPDIRPNARLLVARPYLVLYEAHPDDEGPVETIEIVNVVDGRRDLRDAL